MKKYQLGYEEPDLTIGVAVFLLVVLAASACLLVFDFVVGI